MLFEGIGKGDEESGTNQNGVEKEIKVCCENLGRWDRI